MCTVFEETRREGIAEGEAKGIIETGYEFGISEEEILARLQKKLNISLAEAQEYVKKFGRKRGKVNQKIPMQKKMVKI